MIKFLDLQAVNAAHATEIEEAVLRATRSGWYLRGEDTNNLGSLIIKVINLPNIKPPKKLKKSEHG